jgi:F-type H+-transporting ATPase subunit delta
MQNETVYNKYALALFRAGEESGNIDDIKLYFNSINNKISAGLLESITSPEITDEAKKNAVKNLLPAGSPEELEGFLKTLIDKKRFEGLKTIYKLFEKLYESHKNIMRANIITFLELDQSSKTKIQTVLERTYNKSFKITYNVSLELLGGIMIKIEEELIDGSLKTMLNKIRADLTA